MNKIMKISLPIVAVALAIGVAFAVPKDTEVAPQPTVQAVVTVKDVEVTPEPVQEPVVEAPVPVVEPIRETPVKEDKVIEGSELFSYVFPYINEKWQVNNVSIISLWNVIYKSYGISPNDFTESNYKQTVDSCMEHVRSLKTNYLQNETCY